MRACGAMRRVAMRRAGQPRPSAVCASRRVVYLRARAFERPGLIEYPVAPRWSAVLAIRINFYELAEGMSKNNDSGRSERPLRSRDRHISCGAWGFKWKLMRSKLQAVEEIISSEKFANFSRLCILRWNRRGAFRLNRFPFNYVTVVRYWEF